MATSLVKLKDVHQIIFEAVRLWQTNMVASLADPQTLGFPQTYAAADGEQFYSEGSDSFGVLGVGAGRWTYPATLRENAPPNLAVPAGKPVPVHFEAHEHNDFVTCTLEVAGKIIEKTVEEIIKEFQKKLFDKAKHKLEQSVPGAYRLLAANQRSHSVAEKVVAEAKEKICGAVLGPKKRRVGYQIISTSKVNVPSFGWFKFGGKWAFRARQGRNPLSRAEWLRRYEKRKIARRKISSRTRRSGGVKKLRETRWPRPRFTLNITKHKGIVATMAAEPVRSLHELISSLPVSEFVPEKFQ